MRQNNNECIKVYEKYLGKQSTNEAVERYRARHDRLKLKEFSKEPLN